MLSRVVFALLALSGLALSARANPQVYCDPVTVTAFSVSAVSSTAEGSQLAPPVEGTYTTFEYYVPLATPYDNFDIFFNIQLTPDVTSSNFPGLRAFGFTIALNDVFSTSSTGSEFYEVGPSGAVNNIEFTNWAHDPSGKDRFASNNTLFLNVTEFIEIVDPNNSSLTHITQCDNLYVFLFNNPGNNTGTGANVVGDPQFKGLRGQSFQVHGVDGGVYNLISDSNMQLNTRFAFLEGPRPCPVMPSTGKTSSACWSHPGSYLSELALKTSGDSQLLIVSGEASQGFASIQLNGKTLAIGSTSELAYSSESATGSITVENTHELTIRSGLFELVVENNDGFLNLRSVAVTAENWPKLASHGLLGQTWQNKRYAGKIKEIEGDVDDYLIEDDNMFGDSFLFNKF